MLQSAFLLSDSKSARLCITLVKTLSELQCVSYFEHVATEGVFTWAANPKELYRTKSLIFALNYNSSLTLSIHSVIRQWTRRVLMLISKRIASDATFLHDAFDQGKKECLKHSLISFYFAFSLFTIPNHLLLRNIALIFQHSLSWNSNE